MVNRAFLYLTRKKGKTFSLFLLLSLISIFVVTSLALTQTVNRVSLVMRESLGGQIELSRYRQLVLHGQEEVEESEIFLTDDFLQEILEIPEIIQHNFRQNSTVSGLSFVEGFNSSGYDMIGSIQGMNESKWLPDFNNEALELIEGRHIVPDDEFVVIISETLALRNELEIGDMVKLSPAELGTNDEGQFINMMDEADLLSVQATVIGVFAVHEFLNESLQPTVGLTVNQIFADVTIMQILGLANYGHYDEITLYADNPSHLPEIMERISEIGTLGGNDFFVQYNDFGYERISRELQAMQNLILILLIGIGLVSTIILSLILVLRMRGRVHEVGILLSVGIPKSRILGGFLLETSLLSLVSFILSHRISGFIAPIVKRGLLAEFPEFYELESGVSLMMYIIIYLLILVVTLTTAFISTQLTIRLKPKQILSIGS